MKKALEDLMMAYQRIIRSKCTAEDIEKAPWRCEEYIAAERALSKPITLTEEQINHMADRFCGWPLPEGFNPDGGITFEPLGNKGTEREFKREPSGTNIMSHQQAKEMIRYMIEGLAG